MKHSTSRGTSRGPETASSALLALDAEARAMPTWRKRGLYPETEGVAPRWRRGQDLTGQLRAQR